MAAQRHRLDNVRPFLQAGRRAEDTKRRPQRSGWCWSEPPTAGAVWEDRAEETRRRPQRSGSLDSMAQVLVGRAAKGWRCVGRRRQARRREGHPNGAEKAVAPMATVMCYLNPPKKSELLILLTEIRPSAHARRGLQNHLRNSRRGFLEAITSQKLFASFSEHHPIRRAGKAHRRGATKCGRRPHPQ
jgi:hypothetical protein